MSILIKQALLNNYKTDLLIENNRISRIAPTIDYDADKIIDGANKAIIPPLFNGHTHAAMTLLRGFADDMPLMPWLEEKIWPAEANLTEEDVYHGARLAILEMIKSGTTTFVDMYHYYEGTARAVEEMGVRGMITQAGFDFFKPEIAEEYKANVIKYHKLSEKYSDRMTFAIGAHAIYTVSAPTWKWLRDYAKYNNLRIQTHLSETMTEVNNSINDYGLRPVQYLESLGVLNEFTSFAHCVHLNDTDIQMLADNGCQVVHNPASNMKLASGNQFRYADLKAAGVPVAIGTDGTSSNNNLDMFEEIKLASLLGKVSSGDATLWNADETFKVATQSAEVVTGIKTGIISEGYLADLCLVDLTLPEMTPSFKLTSNLVYSANGSCVDTVICDGKVLMEGRKVEGEEEIIEAARKAAHKLAKKTDSK